MKEKREDKGQREKIKVRPSSATPLLHHPLLEWSKHVNRKWRCGGSNIIQALWSNSEKKKKQKKKYSTILFVHLIYYEKEHFY